MSTSPSNLVPGPGYVGAPAETAPDALPLKKGGGDGTLNGMAHPDFHGRISRLEGANTALLGVVGIVSAILIGGMALLWNDMGRLEDKVDALPGAIREELQALNNSTLEALRAGRDFSQQPAQPPVIVIPQASSQTSPLLSPGAAEWPRGAPSNLPDAQVGPAIIRPD